MNIQATVPGALDPAEMSGIDNTIPIEAWNTVLFEKFCRFRHVLSHGLAGHSDELFRRGLCLPSGSALTDDQIDTIAVLVRDAVDRDVG